jgi:hypothetical protein
MPELYDIAVRVPHGGPYLAGTMVPGAFPDHFVTAQPVGSTEPHEPTYWRQ